MATKSSTPVDSVTSTVTSTATSRTTARTRSSASPDPGPARKTYVIDTSVLLSDPRAMMRFAEHEVVLPVVVVTELEGKRHHPELGYFARQALRLLDDLRISEGRLDRPVAVGDAGGSLRVELNHTDPSALPAGFRLGDNDTRILSVAKNLANEGCDVTIVSKDLPMRVKASACGLEAEEYRHEQGVDSGWTGMQELEISTDELDQLYERGRIEHAGAAELPCHTGLVLLSPRGSGLGRVGADKQIRLVRGDRDAFGLHGRSAE
jgi:PhoH-like ATPase